MEQTFCACAAPPHECTCDARRALDDALVEALGRRGQGATSAGEMRERAAALARRVQDAIRTHLEERPQCPHCAACPALFASLMTAELACEDVIASLDTLAHLARLSKLSVDAEAPDLLDAR